MAGPARPTVAVVGLGLIGGSLALAVGARGFARDAAVRAKARRRGIDARDTLAEAVRGAELVVAAVPPDARAAVLVEAARAAPRAVLTDVASSKADLERLAGSLADGIRFVGSHPLAGGTRAGIEAADATLFRDRPWAIVPTSRTDDAAAARVGDLARATGARPIVLSAARHEELMAYLTTAPLAVASALMRVAASRVSPDLLGRLAGPGFSDTTRLAGTPAELAGELLLAAGDDVAALLDAVAEELGETAALLRSDPPSAARRLDPARAARDQFERERLPSTEK